MSFATLLKQNKTFPLGGDFITIRKHTSAFAKYYLLKSRELYLIEDSVIKGTNKPSSDFLAIDVEFVKEALVSWTLEDENKAIVPINDATLTDLLQNYPDAFTLIYKEIELFNIGLDDDKKKDSLPSLET